MATVISEAGTKEFNIKMAQTKELLQHWENGISVEVIRKECTSNDEEVSGDSEMSDDDDRMSDDDDRMSDDDDCMTDDHFNDADVSRMAIETQGEMYESTSEGVASCSGEEPSCPGWSESLAEGRQEVIDDDEYNEAVEIVMQEEATAGSDEFQSTISSIKLPPKMQKRGRPKGSTETVIGLLRKKPKVGPVVFENMLPEQKEKLLLSWFVGADEALRQSWVGK